MGNLSVSPFVYTDDADLSTGLDSDSLHSDTDLLSTEHEDSDVCEKGIDETTLS